MLHPANRNGVAGFLGTMNKPDFPHMYLLKEVGPRTAAKKAREEICKHWGCNRPARGGRRDCETCKARKRRMKNPVYYVFETVRVSARKRGIAFKLTFEEFQEFDRQTGYVASVGKDSDSLTIDRIETAKGYELGNIRALTYKENVSKKLNGLTEPYEPIAKALCMIAKETNWKKFTAIASDTLELVELLQAQKDGGFDPELAPDEFEENENPF